MKDKCFDAGTIQAFLDGELASDLLENVARHVALCDDCALLLQASEEESAFAFEILGQEFDSLVPTERIRANVFQAISNYEQPKVSPWQKITGLASLFSNPTFAALASLLIVFGIFAAVLSLRNQQPLPNNDDVAVVKPAVESIPVMVETFTDQTDSAPPIQKSGAPKTDQVIYKPELEIQSPKSKVQSPKLKIQNPKEFVDGEETYIKTIATLENTVKDKKDSVLRASSRISYERDMAVINDSIKRMREEVRKNPKNEAAKQILRNSYQNKVELLNSVSERSEMMASLD